VTTPLLTIDRLPAPTLLNAEVVERARRRHVHRRHLLGAAPVRPQDPDPAARGQRRRAGHPRRSTLPPTTWTTLLPPGTPVLLVDPTDDKYAPRLDAEVIYFSAGGPA
jgi:hypothetical protein